MYIPPSSAPASDPALPASGSRSVSSEQTEARLRFRCSADALLRAEMPKDGWFAEMRARSLLIDDLLRQDRSLTGADAAQRRRDILHAAEELQNDALDGTPPRRSQRESLWAQMQACLRNMTLHVEAPPTQAMLDARAEKAARSAERTQQYWDHADEKVSQNRRDLADLQALDRQLRVMESSDGDKQSRLALQLDFAQIFESTEGNCFGDLESIAMSFGASRRTEAIERVMEKLEGSLRAAQSARKYHFS